MDAYQPENAPEIGPSTPLAPAWRRWTAHAIDITIVLVVFALFLAPVIVSYSRSGSSSLLRASAWVYVAVFVVLGVSMARGKKKQRTYLTVGMNIMNVHPVREGRTLRFFDGRQLPADENERRGRAMAAIAIPMMLLGVVFLVFELISYL